MCSVLRRYIKPARAIIVYNILFSFHRIFQLYVVIFISLAFGMVCLFVLCAASMGAGSTNDRSKSVWMLFDGGMLSRLFSPFFFYSFCYITQFCIGLCMSAIKFSNILQPRSAPKSQCVI